MKKILFIIAVLGIFIPGVVSAETYLGGQVQGGGLPACSNADYTTGTSTTCAGTPANAKVELDKKLTKSGAYTDGHLLKASGTAGAVVDAGAPITMTSDTTGLKKYDTTADTWENATSADIPAPKTTVGSGASTRTTAEGAEYVFCTGACTVTPQVPAAGVQLCVMNAPGSATAITLANITNVYYGKTDNSGWQANANYKLVSGGAATDKICIVGYDATHYIVMSSTGTWTHTAP